MITRHRDSFPLATTVGRAPAEKPRVLTSDPPASPRTSPRYPTTGSTLVTERGEHPHSGPSGGIERRRPHHRQRRRFPSVDQHEREFIASVPDYR